MKFDNSTKIGILGGGQLGKMLIQVGLDFDLDISVLDKEGPCEKIANDFISGDITNFDAVYSFGKNLDLITIEIENVNIEALKKLESEGKKVYPQPHIVENIKDKCTQKQFLKSNGIPTSEFIIVKNRADILENKEFLPAVNKLGVGGYDGKGVQVLRTVADIDKSFDTEGILEKFVDFDKELAVIVARNSEGQCKTFPVVEMVFHPEANLVEYLISPANISLELSNKAEEVALKTAEAYGIVGLLAVELFLTKDGEILVNEVAPRPHNSGHQTQKANFVSQYDQHWRAILGLPLGNTSCIETSAMVNILGAEGFEGEAKVVGLETVLGIENIFPFFYGKKSTKPFRKMGHVTILEPNFEKLKEKVNFVKENLRVISK